MHTRRVAYGLAALALVMPLAAVAMERPAAPEESLAARMTTPLPSIGQPAQGAGAMGAASVTAPSRPAGLVERMNAAARKAREEASRGSR